MKTGIRCSLIDPWQRVLLFLLTTVSVVGCSIEFRASTVVPRAADSAGGQTDNRAVEGAAYFTYGDFGSLHIGAERDVSLPWVLASTLVTLQAVGGDVDSVSHEAMRKAYRQFGFHSPERIDNWPSSLTEPNLSTPLGLHVATVKRWLPPLAVTLSNIGCASCHSSVIYGPNGLPDTEAVWIGGSNSSINPAAYVATLDQALQNWGDDKRLDKALQRLYPKLGLRERITLKLFIRPAMQRRATELRDRHGALVRYPISVPGATNGLDALRDRLGLIDDLDTIPLSVFNSIPELGGRVWRTNLLNTGAYVMAGKDPERTITEADITDEHLSALAAITAFFTVPTAGISPETAVKGIEHAKDIVYWLREYRPQPFPGKLDPTLVSRGQNLYTTHCASCHGVYDKDSSQPSLVSFPNVRTAEATDGATASLFTELVGQRVESTVFGHYINADITSDYRAPPLTGIWASAPYFHNGSVPTLWHVMNPQTRPVKFQVGGHALNYQLVGIQGVLSEDMAWAYPDDYLPWSQPFWIDTRKPGFGNEGHESPFDKLSDTDKQGLLEYLKLL